MCPVARIGVGDAAQLDTVGGANVMITGYAFVARIGVYEVEVF